MWLAAFMFPVCFQHQLKNYIDSNATVLKSLSIDSLCKFKSTFLQIWLNIQDVVALWQGI